MFENTQKKGKGWFEGKSVMNEKGKLVAKDHSEALVRAKYAKDKPLCTIVCEPCGHKKDVVDVDEIIDVQEQDKHIKDAKEIGDKEEVEDLEVDTDEVDTDEKKGD